MRKIFLTLSLILGSTFILFAFKKNEIKYNILGDYSNIVWFLSTNEYIHSGSMKVKDGYITVTNGKITGGQINIDVNSIINTDIKDPNKKNDLISFLKSSNFFNVNQYPNITINILSSHPTTDGQCLLKTNLVMKGVSVPIEFSTMIKNQTNKAILIETCRIHIIKEHFNLLAKNAAIPASMQHILTPNANLELEISQLVGSNNNG